MVMKASNSTGDNLARTVASPVVGPFDQRHYREPEVVTAGSASAVEHVLPEQGEEFHGRVVAASDVVQPSRQVMSAIRATMESRCLGGPMNIKWNPDADQIMAQMVANVVAAVDEISRDYAGKAVDEIRPALAARWAAANDGASITEPDLTNIATLISQGKRVWVEPDGRIMADD